MTYSPEFILKKDDNGKYISWSYKQNPDIYDASNVSKISIPECVASSDDGWYFYWGRVAKRFPRFLDRNWDDDDYKMYESGVSGYAKLYSTDVEMTLVSAGKSYPLTNDPGFIDDNLLYVDAEEGTVLGEKSHMKSGGMWWSNLPDTTTFKGFSEDARISVAGPMDVISVKAVAGSEVTTTVKNSSKSASAVVKKARNEGFEVEYYDPDWDKDNTGTGIVVTGVAGSSGASVSRSAEGLLVDGVSELSVVDASGNETSLSTKASDRYVIGVDSEGEVNTVKKDISKATVASIKNRTYTGKAQKPAITVKYDGKTLKNGTDYTLTYKNNVKAGTASVTIFGKGAYAGRKTVKFKIVKAKNGLKAKGTAKAAKYSKVAKKKQVVKKAIKVSKANGKVTYTLVKAKKTKKFAINKKTGAITVPKGTKKGTYTLKIKVTAAGDANHNKVVKTVKVTIKVK